MKPDLAGLTKLAQELRKVPPKQFDMKTWWRKSPCGTTGCIAGYAAAFFPSRFRKLKDDLYTDDERHIEEYEVECRRTGRTGSEAFADGFRISEEDAESITLPYNSEYFTIIKTPKQAAKRVMALVGRLKKEGK